MFFKLLFVSIFCQFIVCILETYGARVSWLSWLLGIPCVDVWAILRVGVTGGGMPVLYVELLMLGHGGMIKCVVGFEKGRVVFTWVDWDKFVVACILRQT